MAPVPLETPLVFPRRMAAVDYLMFRGEHMPRARTAMLSVSLLDTVPDLDRLRAVYDRASRIVVRMRQHVVEPVVPLTAPQWVVDPDFDLTYHVRRVCLPEPGTIRQLLDFAQPLHAAPLDTARPLWEVYLVEGVTEGDARAALLLKMHHAISDGVGGIALAGEIYDSERDLDRGPLPPRPVPEDVSSTDLVRHALRRAPISITETLIRGTSHAVGAGIRVLRKPDRAANDVARFVGSARRVVGRPPVPPSPLLSRRGLGRRLEWHEFPFDRFRRAAKAVGGSVNDAYIAGLCGALRRYHDALGVPIESLPLALPVSLRSDDDPAAGNRFAGARIVAPIGEPDPAQRIALIREQVLDAVAEPAINAMTAVAPLFARLPQPVIDTMASGGTGVDVQASNVPGFPEAPYIAGAKMLKTLAFGPLPGVAMMAVMFTEGGVCYVGIHYDTASITQPELFARCLREGFDEILALEHEPPAVSPEAQTPEAQMPEAQRPEATT
jgi:WS/DGAT/MGAT family acyltransferase